MLGRFAWGVLVLNVFVVLLGAVVRATGSGAGCGANWPTCDGEVIPSDAATATWIEFSHRATSGVALVAVIALLVWVFRTTRPGELVRKAAGWSFVAIISEAAIGAVIVVFEWVADDSSLARLVAVPLHLVNTFVLLASLTVTAWWVENGPPQAPRLPRSYWWAGGGLLLIAATGSVTALADTLFPATSLMDGIRQDLSGASSLLTQVRVIHPVVATMIGAYVGYLGLTKARPGRHQKIGLVLASIVGAQIFAGIANIVLLTPLWMQLLHLALADGLWIMFILFAVEASISDREVAPV